MIPLKIIIHENNSTATTPIRSHNGSNGANTPLKGIRISAKPAIIQDKYKKVVPFILITPPSLHVYSRVNRTCPGSRTRSDRFKNYP